MCAKTDASQRHKTSDHTARDYSIQPNEGHVEMYLTMWHTSSHHNIQ